jgi:hypothetical protein
MLQALSVKILLVIVEYIIAAIGTLPQFHDRLTSMAETMEEGGDTLSMNILHESMLPWKTILARLRLGFTLKLWPHLTHSTVLAPYTIIFIKPHLGHFTTAYITMFTSNQVSS